MAACLAISPDGKWLAAGEMGTSWVSLTDLRTRRVAHRLEHQWAITSVAFSPDGERLAAGASGGAEDGTVKVWELTDASGPPRPIARLAGHQGPIPRVAFSPDGLWLATSGGGDGAVQLWDATEWRLLARVQAHEGGALAIAFAGDPLLLGRFAQHHPPAGERFAIVVGFVAHFEQEVTEVTETGGNVGDR